MKILRIIARLNVGGPARHVVWLTSALQDDEFRSQLIAGSVPPGEDDMSYFAVENNVEPQYIHEMSREISASDINSLLKIYRQIKAEKPDIIHTHTAKAGTLGRVAGSMYRWLTWRTLIGRPRKVRMVHTFHGHVFHSYYSPAKTKIFLWIERLLANASDRIIVISDQQFKEISSDFRIGNANKFSIVPLGIDLDAVSDDAADRKRLREEFGFDDNDVVVGFVGRLTEIKNLSLLLRTAALFKNDSDVKFAIIGDVIGGRMTPPMLVPVKTIPKAVPRPVSNQLETSTTHGATPIKPSEAPIRNRAKYTTLAVSAWECSTRPSPTKTQPTSIIGLSRYRVISQPPISEKTPEVRNVMLAQDAIKLSAHAASIAPIATNSSHARMKC